MSADLSISVSYLSQIESGDRPLSKKVLAALAATYPTDWAMIEPENEDTLLIQTIEACSDPSALDTCSDRQDLQKLIRQQPQIARRIVALHQAYRRTQEQLRVLDDQIEASPSAVGRLPWDQVRDWFHSQQNYIDAIDREAERFAHELQAGNRIAALQDRLANRFGVSIQTLEGDDVPLRAYDTATRTLGLDPAQPSETTLFQLAYQLGRLEFAELINPLAHSAMDSDAGRMLLSVGLANYAAGALLMPYSAFRNSAQEFRHDIDRLRQRFSTSFEQTCHRLSTLQRPGMNGLPVFFCRVDMAGNITKRHSATAVQFAQFGGACPLWVVHEAVAIPDRILVQLGEMPDGGRYVSMAKGLVKPSGSYDRQPRRYAVALGCEEQHAAAFVYADALRPGGTATRIGTSCRICPRSDCEQRAFPPAASDIQIDPDRRKAIPYHFR